MLDVSFPPYCAATYSFPKTSALFFEQIFYYLDFTSEDAENVKKLLSQNGICRFFLNSSSDSYIFEYDMYEDCLFYSFLNNINIIPLFSSHEMLYRSIEVFHNQPNHPDFNLRAYADARKCNLYSEAYSFCLNSVPQIDEQSLSWEQVIEIRKDKKSLEKIRRFQRWVITDLIGKSKGEVEAIIGSELDEYKSALKKYGIFTVTGAISSVIAATPTIIELIESGTLDAAVTIGTGITSKLLTGVFHNYHEYKETKMSPIAYAYEISKKTKKK